jgi:FMN phosphatase YigB (HAD superfamily)
LAFGVHDQEVDIQFGDLGHALRLPAEATVVYHPDMRVILLLDVMETLVTEPYYRAMPGFFGMSLEELQAAKHPTSWIDFEKGLLTEAEYAQRFFRDGRTVDAAGLRRCVWDAYAWLDGMQALVSDLHAMGHEMHALSNYPVWYQMIEDKLCLSRYLQWTFVSCVTGVRKPDPQAYLGAAETLGVAADQCLFIDDRLRNIQAAQALGLDTIHCRDASQVRGELALRGLL